MPHAHRHTPVAPIRSSCPPLAQVLSVLASFVAALVFTPAAATQRVIPPRVLIVTPAERATVSGVVAWRAVAKPARTGQGVNMRFSRRPVAVDFLIDGRLAFRKRIAPYVYRWNTRSMANGRHTLTVRGTWRVRRATARVARALAASNLYRNSDRRATKVWNPRKGGDKGSGGAPPVPPRPPSPEATVQYPTSYFTGPLGAKNILPPKLGAFVGLWPQGGTADQQRQQIVSRETFLGRKLDFVYIHHGASSDRCYFAAPFSQGREQWVVDNGSMPIISWTHGWTLDAVNAGLADECLRDVGRRFAGWGQPILLRTYWEFNGGWFRWSGIGEKFITAWRRTVDVMRSVGATNVGFVWCPDEGNFPGTNESYPGDSYVDWVCSDKYNWNRSSAWCRGVTGVWHSGWCEFEESFHDGSSIEQLFGARKPFMVAETGTVEDPSTPGRKGQWHRNARDAIKARFLNLKAFVYFDVDLTTSQGVNWRLDTSQSSLDGFRDLARDPYFNTRSG
jgi:hypothetical protein